MGTSPKDDGPSGASATASSKPRESAPAANPTGGPAGDPAAGPGDAAVGPVDPVVRSVATRPAGAIDTQVGPAIDPAVVAAIDTQVGPAIDPAIELANDPAIELASDLEVIAELPAPMPLRQPRPASRSMPPPVPSVERRKRATAAVVEATRSELGAEAIAQPATPTVLDRALALQASIDDAGRAAQLAQDLDAAAVADPEAAARLAHELGELHERRLADDARALDAYRRAFALDPTLLANLWALRRLLYRRAAWSELVTVIDAELGLARDDPDRVELLLERALVCGQDASTAAQARTSLEEAVRIAPRHQGAWLELERIVTPGGDLPALLEVWEHLADAIDQPERKIAYWLEVARAAGKHDHDRARRALDAATQLAGSGPFAVRIARERLRLADEHGTPAQIDAALDGLARVLIAAIGAAAPAGEAVSEQARHTTARRRELIALRRRQAQRVREEAPLEAWGYLEQALALAPEEPVVLVDLVELASVLGRDDELPALVQTWAAVDDDASRLRMLSFWCAEAHLRHDQRAARALPAALAATAPGLLLLTSTAECDALAEPSEVPAQLELANTYVAAGRAAMLGTWGGPARPEQPEPAAAAALFVQAADLFAHHVGNHAALEDARDAIAKAFGAAPDHPAVVEAAIELDDVTGHGAAALARLRAITAATPDDRATRERAIRLARTHGLIDAQLELERELVALHPTDFALAWRLEATLAEVGLDDERRVLLGRLAREDVEPTRRTTALRTAVRLYARAGEAGPAIELARALLVACPDDQLTRDVLIDLLRAERRWAELVTERCAEARAATDNRLARRALREAAWVAEIRLDDAARAAELYAEWLVRVPGDRTALEGSARCHATLRDAGEEVTARAAIAELEQSPEAQWLHARSLERAGRADDAIEQHRSLAAREDSVVAATSATVALVDLAARAGDVALRVEAAEALARRTTDPQLGAALFEDSGWLHALADDEIARAAEAFTSALELEPTRRGALLGAALVAASQGERARVADAYVALAGCVAMPDAAAALYLRAAALAAASGEPELAKERVGAARAAAPDNVDALFVAAEIGAVHATDSSDPFAAVDLLVARAELLERRGALIDDPAARSAWELERAEALELAGLLREAGAVVAGVLRLQPDDRRAISALRRIAHRAGDKATWAQASYAIARQSGDPQTRLRMLRDAADVYDRPGPANNLDHALAIYRRILAIDPGAAEAGRVLELLRVRGDARTLIGALTERLNVLADGPVPAAQLIPLLVERATLLRRLGHRDKAIADLDAVLDHAPHTVEAMLLRAELASEAGNVDDAIRLWQSYLESGEPTATRRAEIELRLAQALEDDDDLAAPPTEPARAAVADEPTTNAFGEELSDGGWDSVLTEADSLTAPAASLHADLIPPFAEEPPPHSALRRPPPSARRATQPERGRGTAPRQRPPRVATESLVDPFGGKTELADLSELQEQERREARRVARPDITPDALKLTTDVAPPPVAAVEALKLTTDVAPAPAVREPTGSIQRPSTPTSMTMTGPEPVAAAPEPVKRTPSLVLTPPPLEVATLYRAESPTVEGGDLEPVLDAEAIHFPDEPELSPDDSAVVLLSYDQLQPTQALEEKPAELLAQHEDELATADPASSVSLRIAAGRLCETLGDGERARVHYEAALLADRGATAALRGLRRIARASGDLVETTRLIEAELAGASGRERDALLRYRIDLLMATGEQDIARVAVGELLDRMPSDLPALLAYLELAFLDDRADELGIALEHLAHVVSDPELRATVQSVRATIAATAGDGALAGAWFAAATASDPGSYATRLRAIRDAAAQDHREAAGIALLELACHVEADDPLTATALALRAQSLVARALAAEPGGSRETIAAASQLAVQAAPRDPLVARIATETALVIGDATIASHAFAHWARCKAAPVERAYAAARAAELDPGRLGRLWSQVLDLDPGDDYAAAQLRTAYVAADEAHQAIELDLQIADATERASALLRAADELLADDQLDQALDVLVRGRGRHPGSVVLAEVLAETLARSGRWNERAMLLGQLAAEPGPMLDPGVARAHSALAWQQAAAVVAAVPGDGARDDLERASLAALAAWQLVLEHDPHAPVAHASAILLASRLDDRELLADALARARAAERSPWAASSLALRLSRLVLATDPRRAQDVAREAAPGLDDPRSTLAVMIAAAHRHELGDAAIALEARATMLEAAGSGGEPAMLRFRAAQLALDGGDVARATSLLARLEPSLPGVDDLLDAARRRAGASSPAVPRPRREPEVTFVRVVRDAEVAAARGDDAAALGLYQRALELRPADPLVAEPLLRLATRAGEPGPITVLALDQLRTAEAMGDAASKADAYDLLARADELRGNPSSAQLALESAVRADPGRLELMHRLERALLATGRFGQLLQLRERQLEHLARDGDPAGARDLAATLMDAAILAVRDKRPAPELARRYRAALDADPSNRLALVHLEAFLRRAGASEELATLEEQIAGSFDDPRARATFLTRAGETLAQLGKATDAVQRFVRAAQTSPDHLPALAAWHATALAGGLWNELAAVATHRASLGGDAQTVAALHHFAGVVLMDKAGASEQAIATLRRALAADPSHLDAFLRLRILLDHHAHREELGALLRARLELEPDPAAKIELHRALAEHHFEDADPRVPLQHYRGILAIDRADVRAHAAIADLASVPGPWDLAADAVRARIVLEREAKVLHALHHRLGAIQAPHDAAAAMTAFQRALSYRPGDERTLTRIADLAVSATAWDVAVDACEKLVSTERDPEKLAVHLHRAATIFMRGFGDRDRAERMLQLALDTAPTSTDGLRRLVQFHAETGDAGALRDHLNRLLGVMRVRVAEDPKDGPAYRAIARTITARVEATHDGSLPIARAAAELACLLGAGGELEERLVAGTPPVRLSLLGRAEADQLLLPRSFPPELRHLFRVLGEPIAKQLGLELGAYGLSRKDRLRPTERLATIARDLAASLGLRDLDVYVSSRQPYAMVAEPTRPGSLVIGERIATGDPAGVRFAVGAALKLAQMSLAIPARLRSDELGVLTLAVLRLFKPELAHPGVDLDEVTALTTKLRRITPAAALAEARPHAVAVAGFSHHGLAQDLKIAGLRAGLAASGKVVPGLAILAAAVGVDLPGVLADPLAQGLIGFAIGEQAPLLLGSADSDVI